jgi:hypothetical protein
VTILSSEENAGRVLNTSFDPFNVNMPSGIFLQWWGGGEKIVTTQPS